MILMEKLHATVIKISSILSYFPFGETRHYQNIICKQELNSHILIFEAQ